MIKSTFNTGIDSPLKLALLDRRIKNPSEATFGGIQGNLAYGKIMFTCSPNIGVSLKDKEINQILCLAHKFERNDLMKQGNHPYNEKEILSLIKTIKAFKVYLLPYKFLVRTDNKNVSYFIRTIWYLGFFLKNFL